MIERLTLDGIFPVILDLMRALRDGKTSPESGENLLREAFMRQTIRSAQKDGFSNIAVVCGAWHGPALADPGKIKVSDDAALLKGQKKVKTEATWIPWSFDRLALVMHTGSMQGSLYDVGGSFLKIASQFSKNSQTHIAWSAKTRLAFLMFYFVLEIAKRFLTKNDFREPVSQTRPR